MSVIAGLTGNAAEISPAEGVRLFHAVLMRDEHVLHAYRLFRDAFVFTDRRIIVKDVKGMTGSRIEWHSVPYRSVSHFAIETAGVGDLDAELRIFVSGNPAPVISKTFNRGINIYDVGELLAHFACPAP